MPQGQNKFLTLRSDYSVNIGGSGRGEIKASNENEVTKEKGHQDTRLEDTRIWRQKTHLIIRILPR